MSEPMGPLETLAKTGGRPPQRKADNGEAACVVALGVDGRSIPCVLVESHEGPHENHDERRSWARDLPDDGGAMRVIQASSALVEKHEASGGTAIPVGENAERLFGNEDQREPLAKIVEDVKRKATPPTRDEIDAMSRAEQEARAAACRKEIYEVCVKHDCQLTARPTFDPMVDGGFSVGAAPIIRAL